MAVQTKHLEAELAAAAARGGAFLFAPVGTRDIFTPEKLSDEQRAMYQTGRDFAAQKILPRALELEHKAPGLLPALIREAGEVGLLMVDIPEAYGGLGADIVTSMLVSESQSVNGSWAVSAGAHSGIGTLPIVFFGSDAQKAKYLPKSATGEWIFAYALSEASSGSDALGAKTRADLSPDGRHWVLNGSKQWITNAGIADVFIVFAKVSGDKFTAFIVEKGTPGFSVGREEHKLGLRGSSTCPLVFEDAQVPVENLLGEIGKGHKIAFNILNIGRLKLGAAGSAGTKGTLFLATKYAVDRKAFGKSIAEFGLIREKLAYNAAVAYAVETVAYRAAGVIHEALERAHNARNSASEIMGAIEEYAVEASINKVFGSEQLHFMADEALQVHGGYGFVEDYEIERLYRDERVNRIFEGTNEINRMLIPGMIFKRAMKGQLPLMEAAANLDEEIADPSRLLPSDEGRLAPERRLAEGAKRCFILAARAAAAKFGLELDQKQEVLAALADLAIEAYALDSILARTLQATDKLPLRDALCRLFASRSRERLHVRTREALAGCLEGEALASAIKAVDVLLPYTPQDPAALREAVMPAVLEAGGYPFNF